MEYIRVTKGNLEKEHICRAIFNNKDVQVSSEKAWLADRFDEGFVFLKSVEHGKYSAEYIPAENAWIPMEADEYMYIDCLQMSGSFKGYGYATDLLSACIEDSKEKGKKGPCILHVTEKKPLLADPKFLKYKGFTVGDETDNGVQLWYLPFKDGADIPSFRECAKHPQIDEGGYVLCYMSRCPFNAKCVPILKQAAEEKGILFRAIHIGNRDEAQNAPTPTMNYALLHDEEYVTNKQMSDKKSLKLVNGQEENGMASTKEYLDFVLEQLSELDEVSFRAMMGKYTLYYRDRVFGDIHDDRLLAKPVPVVMKLVSDALMEFPYDGAKEMIPVGDVGNRELLCELVESIQEELPEKKRKNSKKL